MSYPHSSASKRKKARINKLIKDKDRMIMKLKRDLSKKADKSQQTIQQLRSELEKLQKINQSNVDEINSLKSQLEKFKMKTCKNTKLKKHISSTNQIESNSNVEEVEEDPSLINKASRMSENSILNKPKAKEENKESKEKKEVKDAIEAKEVKESSNK